MIEPLTIYAIGCIAGLWLIGAVWMIFAAVQYVNATGGDPILRYRNERSSDQFSNGDKGLGACLAAPGTRPTGHAAFGVDGASRFGPSRGVASGNLLHSAPVAREAQHDHVR